MDDLKSIKSMYKNGNINRETARKLMQTIIQSDINIKIMQERATERYWKLIFFFESGSERNAEGQMEFILSDRIIRLLADMNLSDDEGKKGVIDLDFSDDKSKKSFKLTVDIGKIIAMMDQMGDEEDEENEIIIENEDNSRVKIKIKLVKNRE